MSETFGFASTRYIKIQLDPLQRTAYIVYCFTKCETLRIRAKKSKIGKPYVV